MEQTYPVHSRDQKGSRGAWVAQSVERPTLDFGSGHDLRVVRSSPGLGYSLRRCLLEFHSPFSSSSTFPYSCFLFLSLKISKSFKKRRDLILSLNGFKNPAYPLLYKVMIHRPLFIHSDTILEERNKGLTFIPKELRFLKKYSRHQISIK